MNVLLVSKKAGRSGAINIGKYQLLTLGFALVVMLPVTMLYAGYQMGAGPQGDKEALPLALEQEMAKQRALVDEARRQASDDVQALTLRLGQMQAQVTRLNALGQRLTGLAGLDDGEFSFTELPAQGGPAAGEGTEVAALESPDFISQLDELSAQLADRERQLEILESLMISQNLQSEVVPSGRPTHGGWVSSQFGYRNDPFTGEREYHKGVDVAGKDGSDIIAAASGVVTWSGPRYGYGNLVEINHGNGYVTRYGHCKEVLFKVGDTVQKGDTIALLGNTGRSTGPHLHYEVIVDGKTVDPMTYIQASR